MVEELATVSLEGSLEAKYIHSTGSDLIGQLLLIRDDSFLCNLRYSNRTASLRPSSASSQSLSPDHIILNVL